MNFLPGSIGIKGEHWEQMAANGIIEALQEYDGQFGYKVPSVGVRYVDDIPSFIGVINGKCVLVIDIVSKRVASVEESGDVWIFSDETSATSRDLVIDKFSSEILNRLKEDSRIYNRRDNTSKVPILKLVFYAHNTSDELEKFRRDELIINPVYEFSQLATVIKEEIANLEFNEELSDSVSSLLEGTKAFERNDKGSNVKELTTLSDFANQSLKNTFKLDDEQRKVSMQSPQGPQRIRGLAGTGKTVILALKAALTHKDLPDYKILFVFNTQSMYNQIRNLISKYYIYETREEPDWHNLSILHAWGGSKKEGFYSSICNLLGLSPYSFIQVKGKRDPYEFIFSDLLEKVKTIKLEPIYDMVLIDEAQDFPQPFFELIYYLTKNPKRIIWAYDEFQSLNELRIKEPEELFGLNTELTPNIPNDALNGQYIGGIDKDFILPNSYRNPRRGLMTAHGIGLGLYRQEGIVDIVSDRKSWRALGYEVLEPKKDDYKEGDRMDIERPARYSKNILEGLLTEHGKNDTELVNVKKFTSKPNEYKFIAQEIERLITKEGFNPEQIIVISLASSKTSEIFVSIRQLLGSLGIRAITPGFVEGSDMFQEKGFVTLTTPYRAKGNESEVVFVIDSEAIMSSYSFRARNAAFVSITRSRGWCYITGSGPRMDQFEKEYELLDQHYPHFKFVYPSEEDIQRRRIVFKKNSDDIERSGQQLERIMTENPELLIEMIKNNPSLLSKINSKDDIR